MTRSWDDYPDAPEAATKARSWDDYPDATPSASPATARSWDDYPDAAPPVSPQQAIAAANRDAIARADAGIKEAPAVVRVDPRQFIDNGMTPALAPDVAGTTAPMPRQNPSAGFMSNYADQAKSLYGSPADFPRAVVGGLGEAGRDIVQGAANVPLLVGKGIAKVAELGGDVTPEQNAEALQILDDANKKIAQIRAQADVDANSVVSAPSGVVPQALGGLVRGVADAAPIQAGLSVAAVPSLAATAGGVVNRFAGPAVAAVTRAMGPSVGAAVQNAAPIATNLTGVLAGGAEFGAMSSIPSALASQSIAPVTHGASAPFTMTASLAQKIATGNMQSVTPDEVMHLGFLAFGGTMGAMQARKANAPLRQVRDSIPAARQAIQSIPDQPLAEAYAMASHAEKSTDPMSALAARAVREAIEEELKRRGVGQKAGPTQEPAAKQIGPAKPVQPVQPVQEATPPPQATPEAAPTPQPVVEVPARPEPVRVPEPVTPPPQRTEPPTPGPVPRSTAIASGGEGAKLNRGQFFDQYATANPDADYASVDAAWKAYNASGEVVAPPKPVETPAAPPPKLADEPFGAPLPKQIQDLIDRARKVEKQSVRQGDPNNPDGFDDYTQSAEDDAAGFAPPSKSAAPVVRDAPMAPQVRDAEGVPDPTLDVEPAPQVAASKQPWDGATVEDEGRWFGTRVTVSPEMKSDEPWSGTVTRVLNRGRVVEVRPDGETEGAFRIDPARLAVSELKDSASTPPATPRAATPETDYFKGDQIAYTGVVTPDGLREFVYLEGIKKGQSGVRPTKAAQEARVQKNRDDWAEQQRAFARLHEKPAAPRVEAGEAKAVSAAKNLVGIADDFRDAYQRGTTQDANRLLNEHVVAGRLTREQAKTLADAARYGRWQNPFATSPSAAAAPPNPPTPQLRVVAKQGGAATVMQKTAKGKWKKADAAPLGDFKSVAEAEAWVDARGKAGQPAQKAADVTVSQFDASAEANEIRQLLGMTQAQIDAYDPAFSVQKLGRGWSTKTIDGNYFQDLSKTRSEAVQRAERHKAQRQEKFNSPRQFHDVGSLRADRNLRRIRALEAQGMTEMEAWDALQREQAEQAPAPTPEPPPAAKQPWEMTREQFFNDPDLVASHLPSGAAGWRVSYRYTNPGPAGPSTGSMTLPDKPQKGQRVKAMFGDAVVTSASPQKKAKLDNGQMFEGGKAAHRKMVQDAIFAGKTVPPEVLADYPDLSPPVVKSEVKAEPKAEPVAETSPPVREDGSDAAPSDNPPVAQRLSSDQIASNADGARILARSKPSQRYDVDSGTRYSEYRVRKMTTSEIDDVYRRGGFGSQMAKPFVLEQRVINEDGGKHSVKQDWQHVTYGASKLDAIDDFYGDTEFSKSETSDTSMRFVGDRVGLVQDLNKSLDELNGRIAKDKYEKHDTLQQEYNAKFLDAIKARKKELRVKLSNPLPDAEAAAIEKRLLSEYKDERSKVESRIAETKTLIERLGKSSPGKSFDSLKAKAQSVLGKSEPLAPPEALASGGSALASPAMPMADLPGGPTKSGRTEPAPLADGKPTRTYDEIRKDLETSLDKVVKATSPSRGSIGTYYPSSTRTVVGGRGDLDTTFHEIAHLLDDRFGIVAKWAKPRGYNKAGAAMPQKAPFDSEIRAPIFQQSSRKHYPVVMKRAEGVAEFIRAWMINPDAAKKAAPKFHAWFEQQVPDSARAALRAAGDDIRRIIAAGPDAMTKANIRMATRPKTFTERVADYFSPEHGPWRERLDAAFRDDIAPIMNDIALAKKLGGVTDLLPVNDPLIRIRNYAGVPARIEEWVTKGPLDINNQPVKGLGGVDWIVEPLKGVEPEKARKVLADAMAVGVSERAVDEARMLDEAVVKLRELQVEATNERRAIREAEADFRKQAEAMGQDPNAVSVAGSGVDRLREIEREIKSILKSNNFSGPPEKFPAYVNRKKPRLTGAGAGFYPDDKVAAAALDKLKADPDYAAAAEVVKRYRDYAAAGMRLLRDAGRISDEQYQSITTGNQFYFAWKRVMDDVASLAAGEGRGRPGGSRKMGAAGQPVKTMEGAQRTIEDPLVALIENTALAVREAERNASLRTFFALLSKPRDMYQGRPIDFDQIASRAKAGDRDTVRVFVKGKAEYWQPRGPLYRAFKGMDQDIIDTGVHHGLAKLVNFRRQMITLNPAYMIRNFIRDQMGRTIVSNVKGTPIDTLKAIYSGELAPDIAEMHRFGGGNSGFFGTHEKVNGLVADAVRRVAGEPDTIISTFPKMIEAARHLQRIGEEATRGSEYLRAKKYAMEQLGYDDMNASMYGAYEARSLQDFAVAGRIPRYISRYVTPMVAGGMRGIFKTLETAGANPGRTATRMLMVLGSMELLSALWNHMSGAWEKERDLPAYRQDFFYNFHVGNGWIAVPRLWEQGLPGAAMRRAWHRASGNKNAFDGFAGSAAKALAPTDVDSLIAGPFSIAAEQLWNRDMFTGMPIIPFYEQDVRVDLRKGTAKASAIGRGTQQVTGVDARRVDHLLRSTLGWSGDMALSMADAIEGKPGALPRMAAKGTGFYYETPGSSPDVSWVMDWARSNKKTHDRGVKQLQSTLERSREAPTAAERERIARQAHQLASQIRRNIEAMK